MTTIALLLVAAALAYAVAHAVRVPAVPLLIAAGLGLNGLEVLQARDTVDATLELGLAFLVFAAGIELNPGRFVKSFGLATKIALAQFSVVTGVTFGAALVAGFDVQSSFVLGLALAASSTLVVVRVLQRRRQLTEPFGRLVIGVLVVQDGLVVALMTVMAMTDRPGVEVLGVFASVVGLLVLTWVCTRWVTPLLMVTLGLDSETLLLVILAVLFAFAGVTWLADLPVVVGAFLAGVSMSAFPVSGVIRAPLASLSDFFVALFFVSLGATLIMPDASGLGLAGLLIGFVVLGTPVLVAALAEKAGLTARAGIEAGLLLAQTSEFSLVVALMGRAQGWLAPGLFEIIVLVTLVTMALTPVLSRDAVVWRLVHLHPARRWAHRKPQTPPEGHVLLLGCGQNGLHILELLRARGERVVAVDDDPVTVAAVNAIGVMAFRGDGADPLVLRKAGAEGARLIISTMRRVDDSLRMLWQLEREVPTVVRVFSHDEADLVRFAGGHPVTYADAAADAVIGWLSREDAPTPAGSATQKVRAEAGRG